MEFKVTLGGREDNRAARAAVPIAFTHISLAVLAVLGRLSRVVNTFVERAIRPDSDSARDRAI
jgi:hypothetical protein